MQNAALSGISMVPGIGDAIGKGGMGIKLISKLDTAQSFVSLAVKNSQTTVDAGRHIVKYNENVGKLGRAVFRPRDELRHLGIVDDGSSVIVGVFSDVSNPRLASHSLNTGYLDELVEAGRTAPKSVVVDFAESSGRLGGRLWGADRIPTLQRFLESRGVRVLKDQDELLAKLAKQRGLPGADAAFVVGKDGKLWFLLSKNPTRREVLHELAHFLHRQKIGADAYSKLTTAQKELWVSRCLRNSNNWKRFTPDEQWREIQNILKYADGME